MKVKRLYKFGSTLTSCKKMICKISNPQDPPHLNVRCLCKIFWAKHQEVEVKNFGMHKTPEDEFFYFILHKILKHFTIFNILYTGFGQKLSKMQLSMIVKFM